MSILANSLIHRAEQRLGAPLDYVRYIAHAKFSLFARYGKIFGFLDPNKHVPAQAYHAARIRGAIAADCGECVSIEISLATKAGLSEELIDQISQGRYSDLDTPLAAVARLSDAVVARREDSPEDRELVREAYQDQGLIELSFAMNGAALLPGIKRALGFATACTLRRPPSLGCELL